MHALDGAAHRVEDFSRIATVRLGVVEAAPVGGEPAGDDQGVSRAHRKFQRRWTGFGLSIACDGVPDFRERVSGEGLDANNQVASLSGMSFQGAIRRRFTKARLDYPRGGML